MMFFMLEKPDNICCEVELNHFFLPFLCYLHHSSFEKWTRYSGGFDQKFQFFQITEYYMKIVHTFQKKTAWQTIHNSQKRPSSHATPARKFLSLECSPGRIIASGSLEDILVLQKFYDNLTQIYCPHEVWSHSNYWKFPTNVVSGEGMLELAILA